jgi:Site-specific recombinases, DNA invertase Pin homologs
MARIKYIRVSTDEQNTARQEADKSQYDKTFIDKASGKDTNRPQLKKMMEYVREGDTIVVDSYSRFARNTKDLLILVEKLNEKGVHFISLKEQIDTSTPQGKLMLTIFAGLATFEREQLLQRQAEGIAIAKEAGRYKGRAPINIDSRTFEKVYKEWKAKKLTAREAMGKLGLKPNTFYRRVQEYEN